MAEQIAITDPKLAERVENEVNRLREYYPDGQVHHIDSLHGHLAERITKLYREIGYASRADFLHAYGFQLAAVNKGGRPTSFDAEELLAELARRYEGREKPTSMGQVAKENPDLPCKTFMNKSTELFGTTAKAVLKERGILACKSKGQGGDPAEIRAKLDELAALCERDGHAISTVAQLKAAYPDYCPVIDQLKFHSEKLFGTTAGKALKKLGIITAATRERAQAATRERPRAATRERPRAAALSPGEVQDLLDDIAAQTHALPNEERPRTVAELANLGDALNSRIQVAMKQKAFSFADLRANGMVYAGAPTRRKMGICNMDPTQLARLAMQLLGVERIEPGSEHAHLLPPNCLGIDLANVVELRDLTANLTFGDAKDLKVGDRVDLVLTERVDGNWRTVDFALKSNPKRKVLRDCYWAVHDTLLQSDSPLATHTGCEVTATTGGAKRPFAQVHVRFVAQLRSDAIVYCLLKHGDITRADVAGDQAWRYRLKRLL